MVDRRVSGTEIPRSDETVSKLPTFPYQSRPTQLLFHRYLEEVVAEWRRQCGISPVKIRRDGSRLYPPTRQWPVPTFGASASRLDQWKFSDEQLAVLIDELQRVTFVGYVYPPFVLRYDSTDGCFVYTEPVNFTGLYAGYLSRGKPFRKSQIYAYDGEL